MQLLEIEKELAGPDGKSALERYDGILVKLDERLTKALNQGVPPNEYTAVEQLQKAVPLARKLLRLGLRKEQGA